MPDRHPARTCMDGDAARAKPDARASDRQAKPAPGRPLLRISGPGIAQREYELSGPAADIGRSQENQIVLPHASVSRVHATISKNVDRFTVTDIDSAGGTAVNGKPVTSWDLQHGDTIEIGPYTLQFRTHDETPGAKEAAARARQLLHGEYHCLPSTTRGKYRMLGTSSQNVFFPGDTLQVGHGGVLIPIQDPTTDGVCVELEISTIKSPGKCFIGEVVGVIAEQGTYWMCVRLHALPEATYREILTSVQRGPWNEVSPI